MNAIIGFSALLGRDEIGPKKRKYYSEIIQRRGEDLLSIINDILDISRIESNQIQILKDKLSINEILSELYEDFKQKQKDLPSIKVKFSIGMKAAPSWDNILGDRLRIKQILTNLIDNALKFTREGQVLFGCKLQGDNIQFSVSDTGIGISREMQEQIFDRFRQAEESMTRNFGGNGLGLAISKALVEMMNGKIWLRSEEGKGTQFFFSLPYEKSI
jgi:signal transduction histidine kinase